MANSGYLLGRSNDPCAVIDIGSGLIKAGLEGYGKDMGGSRGTNSREEGVPTHILHNAVTPSTTRSSSFAAQAAEVARKAAQGFKYRKNHSIDCACCELPLTHSHAARDGSWDYATAPLRIDTPVTRGTVRDFGQLENVIKHVMQHELECFVPSTPLILTAKFLSLYDRRDVEPLAEIIFENIGCPALALAPPAPLVLMGHGRLDGIVLDCGHGACTTAAVTDGKTIAGSACTVPIGGIDITNELRASLLSNLSSTPGTNLNSSWAWSHTQVWETVKERFAKFAPKRGHTDAIWALRNSVVSRRYAYLEALQKTSPGLRTLSRRNREGLMRYMVNFDRDMKLPHGVQPMRWTLPDGTPLLLTSQTAECTEILWHTASEYDDSAGKDEDAQDSESQVGDFNESDRWIQKRRVQRLKLKNVLRAEESALADSEGKAPKLLSTPLSDPKIPNIRSIQRRRRLEKHSIRIQGPDASRGIDADGLFKPTNSDVQQPSNCSDVASAFFNTIQSIPEGGPRRTCVASTMLAGGTCLHPGFLERAKYELSACASEEYRKDLHFWSTLKPLFASYQGAALLANSSFRDSPTMVSKEDFKEKGVNIIFDHWAF